jgi:hypothetical protein
LKEETMANGNRTIGIVLALGVGLVGGWLITYLKQASPAVGPGNHLIRVGPDPKIVAASLKKVHKVNWMARGKNLTLEIRFKYGDFPNGLPPFENNYPGPNQDQVFTCGPHVKCESGRVNQRIPDPADEDGIYYKYYQTITDQSGHAVTEDAGIIIER